MAVYSMTGYASVQSKTPCPTGDGPTPAAPTKRLGLELRSVNSRFLDIAFRLPDELRASEPALREKLAAKLKRGKIELRAALESGDQDPICEPSTRLLQRLNAIQDNVKAWLPNAAPLSVADVIGLSSGPAAGGDNLPKEVLGLADQALKALLAAREREGARLAAMLLAHLGQLRALVEQAEPLIPQLVAQQRQRFLDRWNEAMQAGDGSVSTDLAHERALTEATAFAIRIDVAEELTRLRSHLEEIERLIRQGGDIGKRLDFLIQELHREANTLGAKSAALELTHISVDMKVLIEQMREQVQNIE
ncbi:MAG: YicC family protein [Rhodoferax sp.]|nr:YicC family protein [Rhodoferax sp.]